MNFYGTAPQWMTALIAGGALFAAYISIKSQREIARKRAAMDFFVKSEMDRDTLQSHKKFTDAVDSFQAALTGGKTCEEFSKSEEYKNIRDYLNLHELMAVGIYRDVFDDNVCYDFWSDELKEDYQKTRALIEYVQSLPGGKNTYTELAKVAERWIKKEKDLQPKGGVSA